MKQSDNQNSGFSIRLPLIIMLALAGGLLLGSSVLSQGEQNSKNPGNGAKKFQEVMQYIDRNYVDTVDSDALVETAIKEVLNELDPHSAYIPAKNKKLADSQLQGEFEGIGIQFSVIKDTIYVVAPLSGGPSEAVGLQSGDKIIKVNGETISGTGVSNRDVINLLRGKKGTKVEVSIKRTGANELIDFTITRDKIPTHSIEVSYMVDDNTGYIKISRFQKTTYEEFSKAMSKLKDKGMERLVLDLQDNPGGYMEHAIKIADEFLSNNNLIVYTKGKRSRFNSRAVAYREGGFEKNPLIVLIDEGSASASEIVSGAIQDNDRGLIVGRRSFGKGLVQMPIDLSDGSELRLTISRYYTPSGRSIQKPYESERQYKMEIMNRFKHGEMFNSDSVDFADSLKYKTEGGRVVYGGGGIMPDYFVPLDTTNGSEYWSKLSNNQIVRQYTLNYYERNKEDLENMGFEDYRKNFEITDAMIDDFIEVGEQSGVEYDQEGFKRSEKIIKVNIKARIAKHAWDNEGFYPIINQLNEPFVQALDLFDSAKELLSKYSKQE